MINFIKNNVKFSIFLAIVVVVAVVFIALDIVQYFKVSSDIDKILAQGDKIDKVNKTGRKAPTEGELMKSLQGEGGKSVSTKDSQDKFNDWNKRRKDARIVKDNVALIKADTESLKVKIAEVHRVFGHFYDKAFDAFLVELKKSATLNADEVKSIQSGETPYAPKEQDIAAWKDAYTSALKDVTRQTFADIFAALYKSENVPAMLVNESSGTDKKFNAERQRILFEKLRDEFIKKVIPADVKADSDAAKTFGKAYLEKMAQVRFNVAFAVFKKQVNDMSFVSSLTEEQRKQFPDLGQVAFFQVLGLPATLPNTQFVSFIQQLASVMEKDVPITADSALLRDEQQSVIAKRKAFERMFISGNTDPAEGNVPHLTTKLQIYEFLFKTLKSSGNAKIYNLAQTGDIMGEAMKNKSPYRVYTFSITVTGTMEDVRKFINALHESYQTNRVISMSDLSIVVKDNVDRSALQSIADMPDSKEVKDVKDLFAKYKGMKDASTGTGTDSAHDTKKDKNPGKEAVKGGVSGISGGKVNSKDFASSVLNDKNYGAVAVGNINEVNATFHFNYIIYTGESLWQFGK